MSWVVQRAEGGLVKMVDGSTETREGVLWDQVSTKAPSVQLQACDEVAAANVDIQPQPPPQPPPHLHHRHRHRHTYTYTTATATATATVTPTPFTPTPTHTYTHTHPHPLHPSTPSQSPNLQSLYPLAEFGENSGAIHSLVTSTDSGAFQRAEVESATRPGGVSPSTISTGGDYTTTVQYSHMSLCRDAENSTSVRASSQATVCSAHSP
ncbi:hypothetical protein VC83_07758 [Pseudogymnoascus destructans]|uniref:Uncharacterized protein n=1 Tax=Pseudogymnoascus destructans TaxID=655981 RepID=A0A177A280_9PEZI|nr:uncharacterized protein VC83_07758 [Pseudogymnoascus destructans]OAF55700.2 hypothetical protein VC83_07758 [Pseudogymnoascus destructans]